MSIIGLSLTDEQLSARFAQYVTAWYDALDAAMDAAGGSVRFMPGGRRQPWEPDWPRDLRPSWVREVSTDGDGSEFYVDLDGPIAGGVWVTQAIVIRLDGLSRDEPVSSVPFTTKGLRLVAGEDEYLDLDQARERTRGMMSAGRLMASLLEPLSMGGV